MDAWADVGELEKEVDGEVNRCYGLKPSIGIQRGAARKIVNT